MLMDVKNLEIEVGLLHERICSALGDATRIMILYALSENELYVNELADILGLPQPTVSRHLRVLRDSNLVATDRQGTAVRYSLRDTRIIQSLDLMRRILADQLQTEAVISSTIQEQYQNTDRSRS
jgi:ArsR family transcriptional regulator